MSKVEEEQSAKMKILSAARKLFSENGYHGASVNDIVHQAGVNKSLLFYYFNSKENLYHQVFRQILDNLRKRFGHIDSSENDVEKRLEATMWAYINHFAESRDVSKIFMRELLGLGPGSPSAVLEYIEEARKPLQDVINEGVRQGRFIDIDPLFTSSAIVGMLHIFYRAPVHPEGVFNDETVFENTIKILRNGIISGGS